MPQKVNVRSSFLRLNVDTGPKMCVAMHSDCSCPGNAAPLLLSGGWMPRRSATVLLNSKGPIQEGWPILANNNNKHSIKLESQINMESTFPRIVSHKIFEIYFSYIKKKKKDLGRLGGSVC